jgi:hypothetical protein
MLVNRNSTSVYLVLVFMQPTYALVVYRRIFL